MLTHFHAMTKKLSGIFSHCLPSALFTQNLFSCCMFPFFSSHYVFRKLWYCLSDMCDKLWNLSVYEKQRTFITQWLTWSSHIQDFIFPITASKIKYFHSWSQHTLFAIQLYAINSATVTTSPNYSSALKHGRNVGAGAEVPEAIKHKINIRLATQFSRFINICCLTLKKWQIRHDSLVPCKNIQCSNII